MRAVADSARVTGAAAAPIWMVVASDFQCPYCAQWHAQTYEALKREYVDAGKVRMAYVHFPLRQHRHARAAATASLCAGAQGRFWQMHDSLFTTQARWESLPDASALFDSLGARVVASPADYRACVRSGAMEPLIQADVNRALAAGIRSTPTFLLIRTADTTQRGQMIPGAAPIEEFRRALAELGVAPAQ